MRGDGRGDEVMAAVKAIAAVIGDPGDEREWSGERHRNGGARWRAKVAMATLAGNWEQGTPIKGRRESESGKSNEDRRLPAARLGSTNCLSLQAYNSHVAPRLVTRTIAVSLKRHCLSSFIPAVSQASFPRRRESKWAERLARSSAFWAPASPKDDSRRRAITGVGR